MWLQESKKIESFHLCLAAASPRLLAVFVWLCLPSLFVLGGLSLLPVYKLFPSYLIALKKKRELTEIIGAERDVYNSKQYQVVGQWFPPLSLSPFTSKAGQSQTRNIG